MKMHRIEVNRIGGFRLGNAADKEAATGCTVIICEKGAVGGVSVRGGSPATAGTDQLRSGNRSHKINAVVLSGGAAFGLEACSGVMKYLSAKSIGLKMPGGKSVPAVCGAALYDLGLGSPDAYPDTEMGRRACENAYKNVFGNGNNGAGTGASCGKFLGMNRAMKTGIGTYAVGDDFLQIGAISAVNAAGDIIGGAGKIIAGLRSKDGSRISGTVRAMREKVHNEYADGWGSDAAPKHDKTEGSKGIAADRSKDFEMNDIAAAMMAAFQSSKTDGSEHAEAAASGSTHTGDTSAAAYVESVKKKALARAQRAAMSGRTAGDDDYHRSEKHAADHDGADNSTISPEKTEAAEYAAAADAAHKQKQSAGHIRSYEELVDEESSYDDDLGYDIPFNTVISCVITNAKLTGEQANRLASILHDAYARAVKPTHTTIDGDVIFVMATGQQDVNFDAFAALATDVLQYAVIDGALSARKAYGLPAARTLSAK